MNPLILIQLVPAITVAAIALILIMVLRHISGEPRPPGADPWRDQRKQTVAALAVAVTFLLAWLDLRSLGAFWDFLSALLRALFAG